MPSDFASTEIQTEPSARARASTCPELLLLNSKGESSTFFQGLRPEPGDSGSATFVERRERPRGPTRRGPQRSANPENCLWGAGCRRSRAPCSEKGNSGALPPGTRGGGRHCHLRLVTTARGGGRVCIKERRDRMTGHKNAALYNLKALCLWRVSESANRRYSTDRF